MKNYNKNALLLCFLLFCIINDAFTKTDTTYIRSYPQKFSIKTYASRDLIDLREDGKSYKPNNPMKFGLGISTTIKNSILNFNYGFNIGNRLNGKLAKTKTLDLQMHHYNRKFIIDLYFQHYKGFYNYSNELYFYPNMKISQLGIESAYLFNGDRFSARAAFQQTERQMRSAGSFIIGSGIYFFKTKTEANKMNHLQMGGNFGYAYTHVIKSHWFISTTMTGGIYADYLFEDKKWGPSFNTLTRFSAGYNTDNWLLSVLILDNIHIFRDKLSISTLSLQLVFVRRFDKMEFINKLKKKKKISQTAENPNNYRIFAF